MNGIRNILFSAILASLPAAPLIHAAEFEVLDRFSVDGYAVLKGSADIPGGSFTVGGSSFTVQYGKVGIGTTVPRASLHVVSPDTVLMAFEVQTGLNAGTEVVISTAGKVGIGTTAPGAKLEVGGGVKVGDDEDECITAKAGTIRWTGTNFQGCTGTDWLTFENSPPSLTSVSPSTGAIAGGYTVTLTGIRFGTPATVTIGGLPATNVITADSSHITATVPAQASTGLKEVKVINPDGLLSALAGAFTVLPTLTSVSPVTGAIGGGYTITLTGTGFAASAAITIGGVSATNVAGSGTTLTATVPAQTSTGLKDVHAANPDGTAATLTGAFTALGSVTNANPATGVTRGGYTMTITGTGFAASATVTVGGEPASNVQVLNNTSINVTVPPQYTAGAKEVRVTNPDGMVSALAAAFTGLASGEGPTVPGASCNAIKQIPDGSTGDKTYWIDPNGGSVSDAVSTYCDMTSYGGGWTLVARFTNGCWTDSRSAVGTLSSPAQGTCAKLSDAMINLLAGPTTGVFWGWQSAASTYIMKGPRFLKIITSEFNANASQPTLTQQCSCSPTGPWSATYDAHSSMAGVYNHGGTVSWQCTGAGSNGCDAGNTSGSDLFIYQHALNQAGTFPSNSHGVAGGTPGYLYVR